MSAVWLPMSELVFHTEMSHEAEIVMTVIGAIDAASAHRVVEACRREPTGIDVIDLRFVSLFSAAGVTARLTVRETHPLRLVASTAVQQVLEATELADEFRASEPTGPPQLHHAPFGVAVHDAGLRFRYVNDALAAINGLAAQAHYGCRPDDLFDVHHDEVSPILRSVLDTGIDQMVHVAAIRLLLQEVCGGADTGVPATPCPRRDASKRW